MYIFQCAWCRDRKAKWKLAKSNVVSDWLKKTNKSQERNHLHCTFYSQNGSSFEFKPAMAKRSLFVYSYKGHFRVLNEKKNILVNLCAPWITQYCIGLTAVNPGELKVNHCSPLLTLNELIWIPFFWVYWNLGCYKCELFGWFGYSFMIVLLCL